MVALSNAVLTPSGCSQYAAWVSQFNVTYTPLENIQGNSASTEQPGTLVYPDLGDPQVNGMSSSHIGSRIHPWPAHRYYIYRNHRHKLVRDPS